MRPGRTQASGCRVDGKVAPENTQAPAREYTRCLCPPPPPLDWDPVNRARPPASASTEPYMQLVSSVPVTKLALQTPHLVGEATEAWQRGPHRGSVPRLKNSRKSYGEPCLPQPRLASSSSESPGCNPSRVSGNTSPCPVTCSTSLLCSSFLLRACALSLARPLADAASGTRE